MAIDGSGSVRATTSQGALIVALVGAATALVGITVVENPWGVRILESMTDPDIWRVMFSFGVFLGLALTAVALVLAASVTVIIAIAVLWASGGRTNPTSWLAIPAVLIPLGIVSAAILTDLGLAQFGFDFELNNLKLLAGPLVPDGEVNPDSIVLLGGLIASAALLWAAFTSTALPREGVAVANAPPALTSEPATMTIAAQLRELAALRDDAVITEEEFDEKRAQLAARL